MCIREDSFARSQDEKVKAINKKNKQKKSYKDSVKKYKAQEHIKEKEKIWAKQRRCNDIEKALAKERASAKKHKEKRNLYSRLRYKNNREFYLQKSKLYAKENQEYFLEKNAKRRCEIRKRVPSWFSEIDEFVIKEAYSLAKEREITTGEKWHVDHIIPIFCKTASGFHCASNIQLLPAKINISKNNKIKYLKPFSWLEEK